MFYAAVNSYASETSVGFANTWGALGYATRQMRDAYVRRATDMATRAISSKDVSKYGGKIGQIDHYDKDGDLMQHCGNREFVRGGVSINPITAERIESAEEKVDWHL